MQSLVVALDERLRDPGSVLPCAGHLDETGYSYAGHDFVLPEGIDYDLMLTNAGEGILASGMLRAKVVGECDRCLEEASFEVSGEVDEYFLFQEPDEQQTDDDIDFSLVAADNTIDLGDALSSALVMETPFVVLCRPDCLGLCPVCGHNLNEGDCGHAELVEQQRRATSPFAVLAGLDLGDGAKKDELDA
jgi:uncharacterized protein